jgi:NOL1/NOP2/fmu family ribosome biogenesis protein
LFLHEALRQCVDLSKPLKVLDLCAAPGGKSTLMLSALSGAGFVLANEAIRSRVGALTQNLEKWGMANVAATNHDPDDFARLAGFFDVVLVDAPCSGEGLFRKDPNAVREWSEQQLGLCSARQRRILKAAKHLVKSGGVLLYSTCTFNPDENERNVEWLLEGGGFAYWPLVLDDKWGIADVGAGYQFFPHRTRGEGFFMACLKKTDSPAEAKKNAGHPFKEWKKLGSKEVSPLSDWLANPGSFVFFEKPDLSVVAIPVEQMEEVETVGAVLKRRSFGLHVGSFKKQDFIPSHELALSIHAHPQLPSLHLDREAALQFLRKETFHVENSAKGWHMVRFEGHGIGWAKVLDNRTNNYLPNEWRVRMAG